MQAIFCHFTHPQPIQGTKGQNTFFSEEGYVAYQIKRKEVYNIMHTLAFWVG